MSFKLISFFTFILFSDADDAFFERIMTNSEHVLQPFLPDLSITSENRSQKLLILLSETF